MQIIAPSPFGASQASVRPSERHAPAQLGAAKSCPRAKAGGSFTEASSPATQALFCQVPNRNVLNMHDVSNIWQVPLLLQEQRAHVTLCDILALGGAEKLSLVRWRTTLAERWDTLTAAVGIWVQGSGFRF